jgi:hypothetical protein
MSEELEPTGETETERTYPWPLWLNERPHRLAWGEDFDPEPKVFRNYAYSKARKAGLRLAVCIEPTDSIVLQAYRPGHAKPTLPTPYRRLPNGHLDRTATDGDDLRKITRSDKPGCSRCGAPLTPVGIEAGECRKFANPEWRCYN